MQPMSSAITGALEAVTQRRPTGTSPSEPGSGTLVQADEGQLRGWLARRTPAETDQALRTSLRSSLGVEVQVRTETRYPAEGGYYRIVVGCDVAAPDPEAQSRGRQMVENGSIGPTKEQAENWLVALQVATAGGRKSEIAQEVALDLYSGCLMRWPVDVAKEACQRLALKPRKGTAWFPTLAEIEAECERLGGGRRAMLASLRR
jgi:hypothetical protein